jgi:hypothetical protein
MKILAQLQPLETQSIIAVASYFEASIAASHFFSISAVTPGGK